MNDNDQNRGLFWYLLGGLTAAAAIIAIIQFFTGADNFSELLARLSRAAEAPRVESPPSPVQPSDGPIAPVPAPSATAPPAVTGPRSFARPTQTFGPSFDCAKDRKRVEQAICYDQELSRLDRDLARVYSLLKSRLDPAAARTLMSEQRDWIGRRNQCADPGMIGCIESAYRQRIGELEARLSAF